MEEEVKELGDYLDIVRRHKYLVIFTTLALMALSAAVAYILPATYKSEGLILIESQEIPRDLVQSTVTSYADQRIEVIKQKILTTNNVMGIVDKFNLYGEMRKKSPPSEIVGLFRENISVSMVKAEVTDPRSGRARRASIAFKVSFMDKSANRAQKVANELVTRFLNENVRTRTDRARETTAFLSDEAKKFERKVQNLEQEVATFKDKYSDSLPELLQYNLSTVERLQMELTSNQNQILSMKDQVIALTLERSNLQYYIPEQSNGPGAGSSESQLLQAQGEYSRLQAKYSSNHPDVMQLKRQINSLKAELGIQVDDNGVSQSELVSAESELAFLKQRYADNHPDVKALVKRIASLKQQLNNSSASSRSNKSATDSSRNPLYSQIRGRIAAIEREIVRLNSRQDEIRSQLVEYERRIVQTHQVQRAYTDLTRDYENNVAKYRELKAKQLQAELAQNLESENKGESFTLIEPPRVPSKSEKPNRSKVLALGIVASIGIGLGLALLMDMIKGGVRGYNNVTRIVGHAPLVVIPMITTERDITRKILGRKRIIYTSIILVVALIVGFHFFVMNLEIFWFKLMRKISLL
jgi:uncharacterized protein involved in exopolysaccharide biosynthesis